MTILNMMMMMTMIKMKIILPTIIVLDNAATVDNFGINFYNDTTQQE